MDIRRNDRRQMMLARLWIKSSCSTTRPPIAVTRLWRKRGLGVEVHLRQSGEAFDLCKREALVLVVPTGHRAEHDRAFGVFDFNRIASGSAGPGHVQINQLLRVPATSFRTCEHKLQLG
jgi:hypothetical protein